MLIPKDYIDNCLDYSQNEKEWMVWNNIQRKKI